MKIDVYRMMDFVMMALLSAIVIMLVLGWTQWSRNPPPFHYESSVFYPLKPVCPGETLAWQSKYTFTMAGDFVTVKIARVIFDQQSRRILAPDNELEYFVWTSSERHIPVSSVQKYVLPKNLPVGQYELRVGASASSTNDTGYRVPFVIPVSCAKGAKK